MTRHILLAEDEAFLAILVTEALEDAGHAVIGPCQTVAQALAALAGAERCDAAVIDANLRGASAAPVAEALAARGIPFLVTTGYLRSQLPPVLAGAPVLSKPVRMAELTDALDGLLPPASG
ncbi:MAG: response regulator [Sphingomonadales bacterium]|jgi:CheY-like chemotaxis protein